MTEFFQDAVPITTTVLDYTGEEQFYEDALPVVLVDVNGNSVGYFAYVGTSEDLVSDEDTPRPDVIGPVYWMCAPDVTPSNAIYGDLIASNGILGLAN